MILQKGLKDRRLFCSSRNTTLLRIKKGGFVRLFALNDTREDGITILIRWSDETRRYKNHQVAESKSLKLYPTL